MRLSEKQIAIFKEKFTKIFGKGSIYLFGSRTDDSKKGGDIDLLLVSQNITREKIREFRIEFFKNFGEQKLDIVTDDGSFKNPFTKLIFQEAVKL